MNYAERNGTIYVGDGSGTSYFSNVNFTNNTAQTGSGSVIYMGTSGMMCIFSFGKRTN